MSRTATTHFEPRRIPEADRAPLDRRIRELTDKIGRGTWDGIDRRVADRRES